MFLISMYTDKLVLCEWNANCWTVQVDEGPRFNCYNLDGYRLLTPEEEYKFNIQERMLALL